MERNGFKFAEKKSGRNQLNFALRKVITIISLFELVEN
jgi:hypothetical protein